MGSTFVVGSEAELNAALSQIDVSGSASAPATDYTISLDASFALGSDINAVNLADGDSLSIQGNGQTIDGGGRFHGLVDYAGRVAISDLTVEHAAAIGGAAGVGSTVDYNSYGGGGGGAGLGGGLFVASGGAATLDNVTFLDDSAAGGSVSGAAGNNHSGSFGVLGGGGLDGGVGGSGGGGFGLAAGGGASDGVAVAVGPGLVPGAAPGGGTASNPGGADGGGGSDGGGGGIGGGVATSSFVGGAGGFGGGGGFGGTGYNGRTYDSEGGRGGFGGGGGGGSTENGVGGDGGFGGGGGGGIGYSSAVGAGGTLGGAGFGGGTGGAGHSATVPGGGGLGAGGAIFVEAGGSLAITGGTVSGGSVAGGSGGAVTDPSYNAPGTTASGDGSGFGSGLFLQGNEQVTLSAAAGTTLLILDTIADQTGSTHQTGLSAAGDPLAGAGSLRIEGPGTVTLFDPDVEGEPDNTYSGGTTLASGTLELAGQTAAGSGDIVFAGPATLAIDGQAFPTNQIDGFAAGDAIDLRSLAYGPLDMVSVYGSLVTVTTSSHAYTLRIASPPALALSSAADGSLVLSAACYAAGTRIATPDGEVPVEDLRAGDPVRLARGGSAPVRWVGHRRVDLRRHPDPASCRPVRVRAHSFGAGLPQRDLVLSPEHALFLDGALVPVRALIDGAGVVQEAWDRVVYHHVELDRHDIILAEGLAAESYLDTGNRADFSNGALKTLHPRFKAGREAAQACAPLHLDGPLVEAARARLRVAATRVA